MSDQHVYDEEASKRLEAVYMSTSMAERRGLIRDRLDLRPGEAVISIGCGPGFEPAELGEAVGDRGHVYGVDASEAVLAIANRHCTGMPQVRLERADAADIPVEDERFDAAVAVQIYEYIHDIDSAVAELARVLGPGGRAAVYATDWDSIVWHSSNRARMERAIEAWTDVYADPHLGSRLTAHFRDAGLVVERVEPNSILETRLDGTYAGFSLELFRGHLDTSEGLARTEIEAWERDLRDIDEAGETFFNLTQYLYTVRKPE
ncbi:MAG: methyltransferase domain-containing protein [Halobacteriales archaeon]|nr:methyltransferase domain-containing protein [Halobacteriales archaeon]